MDKRTDLRRRKTAALFWLAVSRSHLYWNCCTRSLSSCSACSYSICLCRLPWGACCSLSNCEGCSCYCVHLLRIFGVVLSLSVSVSVTLSHLKKKEKKSFICCCAYNNYYYGGLLCRKTCKLAVKQLIWCTTKNENWILPFIFSLHSQVDKTKGPGMNSSGYSPL